MIQPPVEFSTDSLNLERDDWLEQETSANQLLLAVDCRTNMTNYTLAWSSASGTDIDYNEPGISQSRIIFESNTGFDRVIIRELIGIIP